MISLYKPTIDELWFKQKMLQDEKTMSFNHDYGGTIIFEETKWPQWYDKWFSNPDYFYRYLQCDDQFIGEVAYHKEDGRYLIDILIYYPERFKGYGQEGLMLLLQEAKTNKIDEVYDEIAIDNPSIKMFINNGFEVIDHSVKTVIIRKALND